MASQRVILAGIRTLFYTPNHIIAWIRRYFLIFYRHSAATRNRQIRVVRGNCWNLSRHCVLFVLSSEGVLCKQTPTRLFLTLFLPAGNRRNYLKDCSTSIIRRGVALRNTRRITFRCLYCTEIFRANVSHFEWTGWEQTRRNNNFPRTRPSVQRRQTPEH